jgi:hypothetical protein
MAYIWFRFGNLKYGTATVVAMLHDTLLVIGFMGLSHLLVQYTPWLAKVLLIEPFRINLTIVAAVLTVMSYSMIDTIVVFDRVRENRGKYGHLSRRIINDSINQTLSRTLLTGGTNMMTVFVMYIMGGPGIHGFTFVLVMGILVGTYYSVAIAAPILLIEKAGTAGPQATGKVAAAARLQRSAGRDEGHVAERSRGDCPAEIVRASRLTDRRRRDHLARPQLTQPIGLFGERNPDMMQDVKLGFAIGGVPWRWSWSTSWWGRNNGC